MKKYKISKKMTEDKSVVDLAEFLLEERKKPLLKYEIEAIKAEIRRKHRRNLKDAEQWTKDLFNNPIYHLAIIQLVREGKAKKIIEGGSVKYYSDLELIFETIERIISTANENKKRDNLLNYCDGFTSNRR